MYLSEKQLFEWLKDNVEHFGLMRDTKDDQFCPYDAHTNQYVIEMKSRRTRYGRKIKYPDTMIERLKFDKNITNQKPEHRNRKFLYIVFDENDGLIYVFNVSKLNEEGYDFKWHMRDCPQTTEFDNKDMVEKHVGYIQWADAIAVLNPGEVAIKAKEKNDEQ